MRRLRCRWPFEPWACSCCGADIDGAAPSSVMRGLACDDCLDAGRTGEPFIPLTVRPVEPAKRLDDKPIIAVCVRERLCVLEGGEAFDLLGLVARVRERKPGELGRAGQLRDPLPDRLPAGLVVTDNALELLTFLDAGPAARSPFWQWQVSIRSGGAWRPEARSSRPNREFLTARPIRFGYASRRGGKVRAKGRALWWTLIDPHLFCELPDGWGDLDARALLEFGLELRAWANDQRLPVLQSVSAYGARLLRDSRFGAGWRRKVPGSTNRRMRRRLPGNHYQLLTRPELVHPAAHKWDQAAAHHHAALVSRFPDADRLEARGWYRREPPAAGAPFEGRGAIRAGTPPWADILTHAGTFTIAVKVPELLAIDPLQIPALRRPGPTWQTMTSAEIAHARQLDGVELLDIWCAWTSPDDDDRIREYAWWAGNQLEQITDRRRQWLKPLLLAAYGMLAVKPSRFRNGWKWCTNPDGAVGWPNRYGQLIGLERAGKVDREPQTTNVLWRAIIESQVRLESLEHARRIRGAGLRPIAVYADAVFATGHNLPVDVPPPWRYEGTVHQLTFESPARYRSREETRLPGSPRRRETLSDPFTGRTSDPATV